MFSYLVDGIAGGTGAAGGAENFLVAGAGAAFCWAEPEGSAGASSTSYFLTIVPSAAGSH